MSAIVTSSFMTTEELLSLPDDGIERELSKGLLKEREMTRRGRRHTKAGAIISQVLLNWLSTQPEPRGEVLVGEAAFRLDRDPDTTVGIDVAYISAETARDNPDDAFIIEGVPVLAVEILSPSDKQQEVFDKVRDFLDAGVALVWVVEPVFRTVTVFRPDTEPELFNVSQTLGSGERLPGFNVPVQTVFGG